MKNEFLRLRRSGLLYSLVLVPLLIVILALLYYSHFSVQYSDLNISDLESYSSISDIQAIETDLQAQIDNLNINSQTYESQLDSLQKQLLIYQYLENHYVPFNQITPVGDINGMVNSKVFFNTWADTMIMIVVIISAIVLSLFLFNIDFLYKTSIQLYSNNKSLIKLMINKFLLYLIVLTAMYIFLKIISLFFVLEYDSSRQYILLVGTKVKVVNSLTYTVFHSITSWLNMLFVSTIIYMISLLDKNLFIAMLLNVLMIAVFGFIFYHYFPNFSVFTSIFNVYTAKVNVISVILLIIFKLLLVVVFAFISKSVFKRREFA